jgi:hypothetical protein
MEVSLRRKRIVWREKRGATLPPMMEVGALNCDRGLNKRDLTAPKSVISFETKRYSDCAARHNGVVIMAVMMVRREGAVD